MALRRLLILSHRWLGIPMSLLFVAWFATGIVMMYAGGMPQLGEKERIERLPPLDLGAVRLPAAEAAERAGVAPDYPGTTTLLSVLGRPAWRFDSYATTVFADDGKVLEPLDADAARGVAARFLGVEDESVRLVGTVTRPDQWTLLLARELPLDKFEVDDGAGTEIYVSPQRAEVALVTTTRSRMLGWLGTIPHWFYFTPLRLNQPLWYWTVVGASGLGCVLAILGLALAVTQLRPTTPFNLSKSIRYRGWMRWHYILGVVFGLFTLTWVFSGMLSMEPFEWTRARGVEVPDEALSGGPLELAAFTPVDARAWADTLGGRSPKEIELLRIHGEPHYLVRYTAGEGFADGRRERLHEPYRIAGRDQPGRLLVAARTMTERTAGFDTGAIVARLADALPPDVHVVDYAVLPEYDDYYYSRGGQSPLPVLRVRLDDPVETWVYVDPEVSRVVASINRLNRVERWLYNGLHSLDFAFWYDKRPLWDIGMILLSIGALVTTAIGLVFGVRRLARHCRRKARDARAVASPLG